MRYQIVKVTKLSGKAHYLAQYEDEEDGKFYSFCRPSYRPMYSIDSIAAAEEFDTLAEAEYRIERDIELRESVRLNQIKSTEVIKTFP